MTENIEVETGRLATRPILLQSIAQCRRDKSVLLIARLDRLARSVSFISSLMEGGVEFVAADMPAANKLMLHMMAAFAEFERDQIAARTKSALAAAKARGVILGANGRVLAAARQREAATFAEGLRQPVTQAINAGAVTLRDIADHLNAVSLRTRDNAAWTAQTAQKLLRRLNLRTAAMG